MDEISEGAVFGEVRFRQKTERVSLVISYNIDGDVITESSDVTTSAIQLKSPATLTYMNSSDHDKCILDIDSCPSGFTLTLWIKQLNNTDVVLIDSGGRNGSAKGLNIQYNSR